MTFDRKTTIGLHHLAIQVKSRETLDKLYEKLVKNHIQFEFAPEPLREGPVMHMMCNEPGGIRIEFIFVR